MEKRLKNIGTTAPRTCGILPPYILKAIAKSGSEIQREAALNTLSIDERYRAQRSFASSTKSAASASLVARKNRLIYTTSNTTHLPGTLSRSEGQATNADTSINEAYDGLGATFDLYFDVYGRNSIDNRGLDLVGTVHYGTNYDNARWDGTQMIFGDGDGTIFNRFTIAIDVMGHELTHGVTAATSKLEYHDQPGALNESISDVFGSLVKQRSLNQTANVADWLIGAGLFMTGINGISLRSMSAPGTAYDDIRLGGKDPQPDHMEHYVKTDEDDGGVHINSGIPNKAFYLAAIMLGGHAWVVSGLIWYRTLVDSRLSSTASFQKFADLTADNACRLYGAYVRDTIVRAWNGVGIIVAGPPIFSAGKPAGYFGGTPRVVYRGQDNDIHEISIYPNIGWGYFNITVATGAPAAAGDPMGYVDTLPRVIYRGQDNHIHEIAIYPENGSWGHFDMTAATGAPAAAGDPMGYVGTVPRVVYRGQDNHIHEIAIYPENGNWGHFDMTVATGAPGRIRIETINMNPPGPDLQLEYVKITNYFEFAIDMRGWTLRDVANHVFTFPQFILAAGLSVNVWTKSGENDAKNLFWGHKMPFWNNPGDTAILADSGGNEIDRKVY